MMKMFGPISLSNPLAFTAVWAPTLSAVIVSATQGRAGLRDLFGRLFRWNVRVRWYVIAVLGVGVVGIAARYMSAAVAGTRAPPVFEVHHWRIWIVAGVIAFIADPGPLGEELGWRGFALPRMLERWNALTASILLGVIWGVWHLPAFFIPGMPQAQLPISTFMISIVSLSILMAWVVVNTRGSVVPAILMHWAFNRFIDLHDPSAILTAFAFAAAASVVVLFTGTSLAAARAASAAARDGPA